MRGPLKASEELRRCVALQFLKNMGTVTFRKCAAACGSAAAIFDRLPAGLDGIHEIRRTDVTAAQMRALLGRADAEIEKALKSSVTIVSFFDRRYPEELREIYDPPILLYVKGALPPAQMPKVAVVGSRAASFYGCRTARQISKDLAASGVAVLSGMAYGVDSAAHEGALEVPGGVTIAVLGGGLSNVYPSTNRKLADRIAASGALVSEYPMDTVPRPGFFPVRNRIISGLSMAVLVVEADLKSGALITADAALEQGREVFAVPGNVDSRRSRGTHALLKQGATLATSAEDILEELNIRPAVLRPKTAETGRNLSQREKRLIRLLAQQPVHVDDLIEKSGLPAGEAMADLSVLTVKGFVEELPGKYFKTSCPPS